MSYEGVPVGYYNQKEMLPLIDLDLIAISEVLLDLELLAEKARRP